MTKEKSKSEKCGTLIFAILFFCYCMCYVSRSGWTSALTEIGTSEVASKSMLGIVSTAYFISYGAMQLIICTFVDKVDPRKLMSLGLFGSALLNLAMALVGDVRLMIAVWFFNGIFQALVWTPLVKIMANWLPEGMRAKAGTIISITFPLGTLISYGLSSVILSFTSWKYIFFFSFIFLIISSFLSFL